MYDNTAIKNFKMKNVYTMGTNQGANSAVGTVAGTFASSYSNITDISKSYLEDITLEDCTVKLNKYSIYSNNSDAYAGMLVGRVALNCHEGTQASDISQGVFITRCGVYLDGETSDEHYSIMQNGNPQYNYAVVNDIGSSGGLVGYLDDGCLVIQDSFSTVNVYADKNAGGLVGVTSEKLFMYNSYSSCDVVSQSDTAADIGAGGLVGKYIRGWIKARDCFTTCDIYGNGYTGGAFGYLELTYANSIYDSASLCLENIKSYGSVAWKDSVCTDAENMTVGQSYSGGFVGRIDTRLLTEANNKAAGNFYIRNCQYLCMSGYNNSNSGAGIKGYGCDYSSLSGSTTYPRLIFEITPSLYEREDGSSLPYMPPKSGSLSWDEQKALTVGYSGEFKNYAFPFLLNTYGTKPGIMPYYGNWPRKGEMGTALVYYEKYAQFDETGERAVQKTDGEGNPIEIYGYYSVTTIGTGMSEWTLNTLKTQEELNTAGLRLVEDGYALLSTYKLNKFNYVLNDDIASVKRMGEISISNSVGMGAEAFNGEKGCYVRNGTAELIGGASQLFTLKQGSADELKICAEVYKLPFFLQDISKNSTLEFYDMLDISYEVKEKYVVETVLEGGIPTEKGVLKPLKQLADEMEDNEIPAGWQALSGGEYVAKADYTFFYDCHFAKTAGNPSAGRSIARRPERNSEVYVRSARQFNAIGRYPYYWNKDTNRKYSFIQEMDLNFSTYTTDYCGVDNFFMTPQDWDDTLNRFTNPHYRGEYENEVIGRTGDIRLTHPITGAETRYSNFQNDYNGNGFEIINFKMYTEGNYYVGVFGEVYGGKLENIHLTTDDDVAKRFEWVEKTGGYARKYSETLGGSYVYTVYTKDKLQYINGRIDDNGIAHNYSLGALAGRVYSGEAANDNATVIKNCSVSGFNVIGKMDSEREVLDEGGNSHIVNRFPRTTRNYGFHIGGFAGANCYAGSGYEKGIITYPYSSETDNPPEGSLIKDCYSFCAITKNDTVNEYVPADNIYGIAWTTDNMETSDDYGNTISNFHGVDLNTNVAENIANSYYLKEMIQLADDARPADENRESGITGERCGLAKETMLDVAQFGALLNASGSEYCKVSRGAESVNEYAGVFSTTPLTDDKSFPYSSSLKNKSYILPAVVKDSDDNFVHYGDWPEIKKEGLFSGICYYEKYSDGTTRAFMRGIDANKYAAYKELSEYLMYVDNLDYDPLSTRYVTESGYCLAADQSIPLVGYTQRLDVSVAGYRLYNFKDGSVKKDAAGLSYIEMPNYEGIKGYFNPDFGAAIRIGGVLEDSMWAGWNLIELNYAADNRAYQVRSLDLKKSAMIMTAIPLIRQ